MALKIFSLPDHDIVFCQFGFVTETFASVKTKNNKAKTLPHAASFAMHPRLRLLWRSGMVGTRYTFGALDYNFLLILVALFGLWVADLLAPHLNCVFYCGFYSENGINEKSKKRKRSSFC